MLTALNINSIDNRMITALRRVLPPDADEKNDGAQRQVM